MARNFETMHFGWQRMYSVVLFAVLFAMWHHTHVIQHELLQQEDGMGAFRTWNLYILYLLQVSARIIRSALLSRPTDPMTIRATVHLLHGKLYCWRKLLSGKGIRCWAIVQVWEVRLQGTIRWVVMRLIFIFWFYHIFSGARWSWCKPELWWIGGVYRRRRQTVLSCDVRQSVTFPITSTAPSQQWFYLFPWCVVAKGLHNIALGGFVDESDHDAAVSLPAILQLSSNVILLSWFLSALYAA
jgi:hypothetical protein